MHRKLIGLSGVDVSGTMYSGVDHDCMHSRTGIPSHVYEQLMREEAREPNHPSLRKKY